MARLLTDFDYARYADLASSFEGDVGTMSPRMMRMYLQYRLHLVEAQISVLAYKLGIEDMAAKNHWPWTQAPLSEEECTSLSSLDYLMTARDSLRSALRTG